MLTTQIEHEYDLKYFSLQMRIKQIEHVILLYLVSSLLTPVKIV